ncbi:MAG: hypothetical protein SVU32_07695 [Candidatus Nanohaloarchaea archaeon]|nr:hypothetical protein [Candidatus Nanohaloarchaea archaeon]
MAEASFGDLIRDELEREQYREEAPLYDELEEDYIAAELEDPFDGVMEAVDLDDLVDVDAYENAEFRVYDEERLHVFELTDLGVFYRKSMERNPEDLGVDVDRVAETRLSPEELSRARGWSASQTALDAVESAASRPREELFNGRAFRQVSVDEGKQWEEIHPSGLAREHADWDRYDLRLYTNEYVYRVTFNDFGAAFGWQYPRDPVAGGDDGD